MPTPAPRVSVQEVYNRVLQRTDLEKVGAGGLVSQSEVLGLINLYMNRLAMEIDKAYESYRMKFTNIQTQANILSYPLPADFYKLAGIGIVNTLGETFSTWTPLQHWEMVDMNSPGSGFMNFTSGYYNVMSYRIFENQLKLRTPNSAQILAMYYIPVAPRFVSLSETMPDWMMLGWEEYLVCGAAAMINAKQEIVDPMVEQLMAMILEQVKSFVPNRDSFQPETVKRTWLPNSMWPFFGTGYGGGNGGFGA